MLSIAMKRAMCALMGFLLARHVRDLFEGGGKKKGGGNRRKERGCFLIYWVLPELTVPARAVLLRHYQGRGRRGNMRNMLAFPLLNFKRERGESSALWSRMFWAFLTYYCCGGRAPKKKKKKRDDRKSISGQLPLVGLLPGRLDRSKWEWSREKERKGKGREGGKRGGPRFPRISVADTPGDRYMAGIVLRRGKRGGDCVVDLLSRAGDSLRIAYLFPAQLRGGKRKKERKKGTDFFYLRISSDYPPCSWHLGEGEKKGGEEGRERPSAALPRSDASSLLFTSYCFHDHYLFRFTGERKGGREGKRVLPS